MQFRIMGVNIYISFFFYVGVCLILLTDRNDTAMSVLVGVIGHEISHLIAMRKLKCLPESIIISPGGFNIRGRCFVTYTQQVIISLAGPLFNIIGALLIYIVYTFYPLKNLQYWSVSWLLLGCINLLPTNGLDGGTILQTALLKFLKPVKVKIILQVVSLTILSAFSFLTIIFSNNYGCNLSFILFGIYLLLSITLKI